jgi:hypothetical protein
VAGETDSSCIHPRTCTPRIAVLPLARAATLRWDRGVYLATCRKYVTNPAAPNCFHKCSRAPKRTRAQARAAQLNRERRHSRDQRQRKRDKRKFRSHMRDMLFHLQTRTQHQPGGLSRQPRRSSSSSLHDHLARAGAAICTSAGPVWALVAIRATAPYRESAAASLTNSRVSSVDRPSTTDISEAGWRPWGLLVILGCNA